MEINNLNEKNYNLITNSRIYEIQQYTEKNIISPQTLVFNEIQTTARSSI